MKTLEQYRDQWGCQSCNNRTSRYSMHSLQFLLAQLDLLQEHIILTRNMLTTVKATSSLAWQLGWKRSLCSVPRCSPFAQKQQWERGEFHKRGSIYFSIIYLCCSVSRSKPVIFPVLTVFLSNWSESEATTIMEKLGTQLALYRQTSSLWGSPSFRDLKHQAVTKTHLPYTFDTVITHTHPHVAKEKWQLMLEIIQASPCAVPCLSIP